MKIHFFDVNQINRNMHPLQNSTSLRSPKKSPNKFERRKDETDDLAYELGGCSAYRMRYIVRTFAHCIHSFVYIVVILIFHIFQNWWLQLINNNNNKWSSERPATQRIFLMKKPNQRNELCAACTIPVEQMQINYFLNKSIDFIVHFRYELRFRDIIFHTIMIVWRNV